LFPDNFMGLGVPYVEPALGPLGPIFIFYVVVAAIGLVFVWMRDPKSDAKNRLIYVTGIGIWTLLGLHDALAALGMPTFQYVMEYGFLGFAMAVLWVVYNNYLEITAEEKYRVITEFANDCIMVLQDEKVVFENPACRHFAGKPHGESKPGDFLQMMTPEDRKGVLDHFRTLRVGDRLPARYAFSLGRKNEERRFVEISSSAIQYRNRPAILTVMRDITERKKAEEALKKSEERLRIAGKVSYDIIYEWDVQNDHLEWFSDVDGFLGYRKGKISGNVNAWLDLIHPEDRGKLEKAVALHRKSTTPIKYRYRVKHHDGTYRYWEDQGLPLLNEKGLPHKWIGVCTDITESKRAEEALRETEEKLARSRKMESIGLLAGGVAHDLNNILSGIISYPQLMLLEMGPENKLRDPLERIQEAGRRAAAVVDDLLTVARGIAITKVPLNLNQIVRDYLYSPEFKKTQHYHPTVSVKTVDG
jgi:PAS domain S-box-containing protein